MKTSKKLLSVLLAALLLGLTLAVAAVPASAFTLTFKLGNYPQWSVAETAELKDLQTTQNGKQDTFSCAGSRTEKRSAKTLNIPSPQTKT